MKQKKTITCIAFLLMGLGGLLAQESPNASGGQATGAGGSSTYTVGQVVYITATGTTGSVAQGVQQAYEISVMVGINETTINVEMSVYPNPATHFLSLKVERENLEDLENLSFQLYDLHGKVIENKSVTESTTTIQMEALPKAVYFLKVIDKNQAVKTFKIIKN